ncbi:hypothetical protein PXH66_00120 [Synoicihabitans lomoniglobus]|uniref:Uncharacterized protein n=1 Tax=Synoicihabitans lomoniglobus TaxID=2909285 RepID=A0AAE9ZYZ9_9BACT|nr:hypothetical protein PXH66_00120 [Opitutaceae bacterium LMO-M01]
MSVDQTNVVDAIGRLRDTGDVALTISDHLDWDSPEEHLFTLQEKINSYLAFIESGQIWEEFEDAKGKKVFIDVYFRVAPPEGDAMRFLATARQAIESAGFHFRYHTEEEGPIQSIFLR